MRHNGCFATRESFTFDTERHRVENWAICDGVKRRFPNSNEHHPAGSCEGPAFPLAADL